MTALYTEKLAYPKSIVTLGDILKEEVDESSTDPADSKGNTLAQEDSCYLLYSDTSVRDINRPFHFQTEARNIATVSSEYSDIS